MTENKKTIGLALGSGGIKGLAHVGVIKTLARHNIPIDFIAGTSIGAWVGAHYAICKNIEKLEIYTIGKKKEKLHSMFELTLKGGFIKGNKIQHLFEQWLEDASFQDAQIPLKIIATELINGKEVAFSSGKIAPALRASMGVPSIFAPFAYNDMILVDGGICNPVPADIVRKMGANIVISVNLDNYRVEGLFKKEDIHSIAGVSARSIDLLRHYLATHCVKSSDVVIEPKNSQEELSAWKNYFTHDIGNQHIKLGEEATEDQIPLIKELLYSAKSD
ncbi:MAG: patatin-like phospholipase family protein [Deltaproteobacteria bacterium]|nr:patatin-like phospholipase family protein [Deltaproteobacteria bacterium]